jgi:hypothetical protein
VYRLASTLCGSGPTATPLSSTFSSSIRGQFHYITLHCFPFLGIYGYHILRVLSGMLDYCLGHQSNYQMSIISSYATL